MDTVLKILDLIQVTFLDFIFFFCIPNHNTDMLKTESFSIREQGTR